MKERLLLHTCCGPCAAYCVEKLKSKFYVECFFYNPNIYPTEECYTRLEALKLLSTKMNFTIIEGEYEPAIWSEFIKGLEDEHEGGRRCYKCFYLRLHKTAKYAFEYNFDYFGTTLTISPHKDTNVVNSAGLAAEKETGIKFYVADFKQGYRRSCEISRKYNLYRQNYCGCKYSIKPRKT